MIKNKKLATRLASKLAPLLRSIPGVFEDGDKFVLATEAGQLSIRIMDDWVACRFLNDDLEAVYRFLNTERSDQGRLNRCSGKWNWHLWHVQEQESTAETLDLLAECVWREVEDLTHAKIIE